MQSQNRIIPRNKHSRFRILATHDWNTKHETRDVKLTTVKSRMHRFPHRASTAST